jgi:hypothetical protein
VTSIGMWKLKKTVRGRDRNMGKDEGGSNDGAERGKESSRVDRLCLEVPEEHRLLSRGYNCMKYGL